MVIERRHGLEDRRRVLKQREYYLDLAANIASGIGEYMLANHIWSLVGRLKTERIHINTELAKMDNPNYPGKKNGQAV